MSHRRLLFAASAALLATLSATSALAAVSSVASPRSVTVQRTDVPSGFSLASGSTVTNAQMASKTHVPKSQFDRHGRISGYDEEYRTNSVKGVTNIFANVYTYKSAAGATWDYSQSTAHDLQKTHRINVSSVGQSAIAFTTRLAAGKQKVDIFGIDFRRGKYDVTVGVGGLAGHVHLSDALKYARLVDHRIQTRG